MNPDPTSLDRLHDIVAPPPLPWWPPAPAWLWVLGFLAVLVTVALARGFYRWQRNRYRREALEELQRQETALADPARRAPALASIAELLKRAALSAWPREQVASLNGAVWLAFLDRTGGTGFAQGTGQLLASSAYDPRQAAALSEEQLRELCRAARHWLIHHRPEDTQ